MKTKKGLIIAIITILMCIPTKIFGWLQYSTYEVCNTVNVVISWILKTVAFIIAISYITGAIQYIKHSNQEGKQKIKNVLTWLMAAIIEIAFLGAGASWVVNIGMETYWSSGKRFQFNEIDGYISNGIRIIALISIIAYIITTIIYISKSKKEKIRKIENVIRWQIITSAIVAVLLLLARNW